MASRSRRDRLIGPAPLVALLAAALGGLGALHVDRGGEWTAPADPGTDRLAEAWLRAAVERHPGDAGIRLRLAREQLALGKVADAERTLAPLVDAGTDEALVLDVEAAIRAWRGAVPGTSEREEARSRTADRIARLVARSDAVPAMQRVRGLAREIGRHDLAARAAEAAAVLDGACARWLSEAAHDHLAGGDPAGAAERLARASGCSDGDAARTLGLAALDAWVAADRRADALRLADALVARFPLDRVVLDRAQRIALSAEDPERARSFGARLVDLGALDAAALLRQLHLDLAAGDLDAALRDANRLVAGAPWDARARRLAADVATWAGRLRVALDHRMWLARRGDAAAAGHASSLARALEDDATLVEVLTLQSRRAPLSSAALASLAAAVERLGSRSDAIAALEEEAGRHPASRAAWDALAELRERGGDLEGALAARAEVARQFGHGPEVSMQLARLEWALGRPERALPELRRWIRAADHAGVGYWKLLAELAWQEGEDELAARAYGALWEAGRIDVAGVERLVLLARASGRSDDAIRYGHEGWSRTGEPRLLLLAMDEAARVDRWGELARLAREARGAEGNFARFPTYWMLRARLADRASRIDEALAAYRRALDVAPGAVAARAGLVWLLVAAGDRERLGDVVDAWNADAQDEPGLWGAYAAALELLGREREALAFHERQARAAPGDAAAHARWAAALRRGEERRGATFAAELGIRSFGPLAQRRLAAVTRSTFRASEVELHATFTELGSRGGAQPVDGGAAELLLRVAAPALGGRAEVSGGVRTGGGGALPEGTLAFGRELAAFAQARLEAAWNEPAADSAALLVDSARDRVAGALTLFGDRAHGRAGVEWRSWTTRAGNPVGSGGAGHLELATRVRGADPEIRVRLQGHHQRNRLAASAPPRLAEIARGAPLLPDELTTVGVGVAASAWRLGRARLSTDAWVGWMTPPSRPAHRLQAGVAIATSRATALSVEAFAANDRLSGAHGEIGVSVSVAYRSSR